MELPSCPPPDFAALYERHFEFVWRTLRHLGVPEPDALDASQEVFIIVHRRLPSFEARAKVTTWLFQICYNLARDRRRSAQARYEVLGDAALDAAHRATRDPFAELARHDKLAELEAALDAMDLELRAVFVLFEIEGMSGVEAAEALGVPLGTAYSRLRIARQAFLAATLAGEEADSVPAARHRSAR